MGLSKYGILEETYYEFKNNPLGSVAGATAGFFIAKKMKAHPIVIGVSAFAGLWVGGVIQYKIKKPKLNVNESEPIKGNEVNLPPFDLSINANSVSVPNGNYEAIWSADQMKITVNNKENLFKTKERIRGVGIKTSVQVKDGNVYPTIYSL
jgi:hypothetical protein